MGWSPPRYDGGAPLTGYIIEMAPGNSIDFVEFAKVDGKTTEFEAKDLREGQSYNFRVRAQNSIGISVNGTKLPEPVTASPSFGKPAVLWLFEV